MNYERMGDDVPDGAPMSPARPEPVIIDPSQLGQPVIFVEGLRVVPADRAIPLIIAGSMHIVLALLMIIFNIVACTMFASVTRFIAPGIWLGIFIAITGTFGILAGKKLSRPFVITFLVLSILSAVFVWILVGIASTGLVVDHLGYSFYDAAPKHHLIAINATLVAIGVFECVAAIVASGLGCCILCGRDTMVSGHVQYISQGGQPQVFLHTSTDRKMTDMTQSPQEAAPLRSEESGAYYPNLEAGVSRERPPSYNTSCASHKDPM